MSKYILDVRVIVSSYQTLQFEVEGKNKEEAIANFETKDYRRDLIRAVDVKYPSHVWESIQTTQLSRWADEDFQDVAVQTKVTDVEEVSSAVAEIRTKGGYVFHVLQNGKVVDEVNSKDRTMSWPDLASFQESMNLFEA
jgi:hypothetical protein